MNSIATRKGRLGLTYFEAPPELRKRIRTSLRAAGGVERAPWWQRLSWTVLAPAATAAFAVLTSVNVALLTAMPSKDDRIADEIVTSHVRALMTSRPIDVVSSDQHTVKPWYTGKLDFSPPVKDFAAEGFALVGGRIDYVDGHMVAALVYRHREHLIDAFLWPAADEREPATLTRRGYSVTHASSHGMTLWLASDLEAPALMRLETLIASAGASAM
jgi:anti-sigma factor RsiW